MEAINITTGRALWKHERRTIISSGSLTTDGGLVIGGDASRRVVAWQAQTGDMLWALPLSAAIGGFPMIYMVDGKQYLAIPVGTNTLVQFSSPLTPENIVPADRTPGNGSVLMVFALPDGL